MIMKNTYQNLQRTAKAMLRMKFITLKCICQGEKAKKQKSINLKKNHKRKTKKKGVNEKDKSGN